MAGVYMLAVNWPGVMQAKAEGRSAWQSVERINITEGCDAAGRLKHLDLSQWMLYPFRTEKKRDALARETAEGVA